MALHVPKAPGFAQMLKDGARVSACRIKNHFGKHVANLRRAMTYFKTILVLFWPGRSGYKKHWSMQRILAFCSICLWTKWNEQNGHQPSRKNVRYK